MAFKTEWFDTLDAAITICDKNGIILYMNEKSIDSFRESGRELMGTNLLDCHSGPSRIKLEEMLRLETSNTYTIEKSGVKKLIVQKPLYTKSGYDGFIEISIVLPDPMVHHVRS